LEVKAMEIVTSPIRDITDLTPVRGQDGKISRHPRERFLVSNEALPSWRPIEIFPAGVLRFFRLALLPVFDSFSH
jgi:hypothetical protein